MREMKDSGVEWIGEIPISWVQKKVKYIVSISSGSFISKEQYEDDGKYPVIGANGEIGRTNKCNNQEYVITTGRVGTIGTAHKVQKSWITDNVLIMSDIKANIDYFRYAISSFDYQHMTAGTAMPLITATKINNQVIPFPSRLVQQKIAAHLDRKCTQIDALISNAQQQIEKLKAYKQSIITETVTKGLDPDVAMKDSGVEWIREIPEHWTVAPIRSFFKIKKDIIGHEPDTVLSITQGGIKVKDINENSGQMANSYAHYQIVNIGDFAMNHMDLLTGGVGISEFEGVTSPDYRVFVMRNADMNPRYFLYVFQMYYRNKIFYAFGQGAANLGRWRLPAQNFNTVAVPLSPVEEQNNIVTFLEEKCSQIDKLIDLKQQKIEKLQKYKKSLIYEYVTGKKEV